MPDIRINGVGDVAVEECERVVFGLTVELREEVEVPHAAPVKSAPWDLIRDQVVRAHVQLIEVRYEVRSCGEGYEITGPFESNRHAMGIAVADSFSVVSRGNHQR